MTPTSPKFEGDPEEQEDNKAEGKEDGEVAVLGAPADDAEPLHAPLQQVARLEELIILPTQTHKRRLIMCMHMCGMQIKEGYGRGVWSTDT